MTIHGSGEREREREEREREVNGVHGRTWFLAKTALKMLVFGCVAFVPEHIAAANVAGHTNCVFSRLRGWSVSAKSQTKIYIYIERERWRKWRRDKEGWREEARKKEGRKEGGKLTLVLTKIAPP